MGCCILGALIVSQILLWWRRLTGEVDSAASATVSAAGWRPDGMPEPVLVARRRTLRAAVVWSALIIASAVTGFSAVGHTSHETMAQTDIFASANKEELLCRNPVTR
jgi:hypothetical protein